MGRPSFVRIRKASIMLVAIEPGEEPPQLRLAELAASVEVLRVRHALPACHRMRNVRPAAVLVGPGVRSWAMGFLQQAGRETGAVVLQLGPLVARAALREWLLHVVDRSQRADADASAAAAGSQSEADLRRPAPRRR